MNYCTCRVCKFGFVLHLLTTVSIQISASPATPTTGQSYTLICNVSGASVTTYQWRKNGMVLPEMGPTLSFSSFRLSNAGRYTCNITVDSVIFRDDENVTIQSKHIMCAGCHVYVLINILLL